MLSGGVELVLQEGQALRVAAILQSSQSLEMQSADQIHCCEHS